jgi:hypothetical protein
MVTPHFSAVGKHFSSESMTHPKASSSVWPGSIGSMPRLAMSSSKSFDVPQRPVFTRIVGMPSAYDNSMARIVWSIFFCRTVASGDTKP